MTEPDSPPKPSRKVPPPESPAAELAEQAVERVDSSFLEVLIGYNARRAAPRCPSSATSSRAWRSSACGRSSSRC